MTKEAGEKEMKWEKRKHDKRKQKELRWGILLKGLLMAAVIFCGMAGMVCNPSSVRAAEGEEVQAVGKADESAVEDTYNISELSQLMTAERAVDMKVEPEDNAETIMSYKKGASVFVTGRTENGWYRVIYQDKEGYIPEESVSVQEMDVEGLDAEMANTEREAELIVEMVEKNRSEARRSRIWGSVILVLVVGIFATGVISGIRSRRNEPDKLTDK